MKKKELIPKIQEIINCIRADSELPKDARNTLESALTAIKFINNKQYSNNK